MTHVVFSPHAYRMQRVGGVSRYVTQVSSALRELGVDVEVLAYLNDNVFARAEKRGRHVRALRPEKVRQAVTLAVNTCLEQVSPTRRHCDVYHYSYYPRFRTTRTRDGITAVTVYDMIHERYPADFDAADRTAQWKRQVCHSADVIFAISESTKVDIVERLRIPAERIIVTLLGPSSLPALPRHEASPPFFLFVGERRRAYKNFSAALRGMATLGSSAEVELLCAGGGALTAAESALIERLGLRGRVRGLEVTDEGLAHLYAQAYALFVPSKYEGFGLPLLEAMQAGCPIVCSRVGAMAEVTAGAAVTFDPESVEDMARALAEVVGDAELRDHLGARGRTRVADFSWKRCALATLEGYRRGAA